MGKPTGFMEVDRSHRCRNRTARAHQELARVQDSFRREATTRPRLALHGLRHSLLPHRPHGFRHGQRLPGQQPDPRVERPHLPRPLEGSARTPSQDEQLPGIHRPRLPRSLRRLLRARRRSSRPSPSRTTSAPSSTAAGRKAGSPHASPRSAPARKSPSSVPVPPDSPAPTNSTRPATASPSSSARTASAACSCMAFLT